MTSMVGLGSAIPGPFRGGINIKVVVLLTVPSNCKDPALAHLSNGAVINAQAVSGTA